MNPPLHTRVETTIKAVDRSWLLSVKEGEVIPSAGKVIEFWDAKGVCNQGILFQPFIETRLKHS